MRRIQSESGFSLPELLVATLLMLVISGIVTQALLQITQSQTTIWNRTEMHSGIRGATELLQQEVGQAGRVSLPGTKVFLPNGVTAGQVAASCDAGTPSTNAVTVTLDNEGTTENPTKGIYASAGPPAA